MPATIEDAVTIRRYDNRATNTQVGRIDTYCDTWQAVKFWAEKSLQDLRERNDSINLDPIKTASIRGDIKRLKALLDLPVSLLSREA